MVLYIYRFSLLYLRHRYIDDPLTLKKISEKNIFNFFSKKKGFIFAIIAHLIQRLEVLSIYFRKYITQSQHNILLFSI